MSDLIKAGSIVALLAAAALVITHAPESWSPWLSLAALALAVRIGLFGGK